MSDPYRLFGSELSPYSVKVRSYFRYKGIPHTWIRRNARHQEAFDRYARLPLIPLVVTPDGQGLQDSTPIIEAIEKQVPEPSIHPTDPALRFLSALIEEYGDEWGNKPMFHFRWFYEADRESAGERIARSMMPDLDDESLPGAVRMVQQRMVGRLSFVGSCADTKAQIEDSFDRQLEILERHLAPRSYLFGGRPAFADFGLAPQLYQCLSDPTPGDRMRRRAPHVVEWVETMLHPWIEGEFEGWEALAPTLEPLLEREVGAVFLPWSDANARALEVGAEDLRVEIDGRTFSQTPQKYHAKSLRVLRGKYAAVSERGVLDPILERTGCRRWL